MVQLEEQELSPDRDKEDRGERQTMDRGEEEDMDLDRVEDTVDELRMKR